MADRALLVSAGSLLNRGFVSIPTDRTAPDGRSVNALYGVARSIERSLALKAPDYAVAVLGRPRNVPGALADQYARAPRLIQAAGIQVVEVDREEDIIAAYVRAATAGGCDVVVLGSDKRYAQLVTDGVWWHDAYKDARYTPQMVVKRFEVPPALVAQWLALVGDAETLPGVKGIGKKSATTLLTRFGSVEGALEQIDTLDTRTKNALIAAGDSVRAELARAHLDASGSAPRTLDELPYDPPDIATLNALYAELGFVELLSSADDAASAPLVCDDVESVRAALKKFGSTPVAFHLLTDDPSPLRGDLAGLAAVTEAGERFYFPLSGPASTVELTMLSSWLEDPERPKVGHETALAMAALARRGITLNGIVGDSACASHLTEPSNLAPHDLPIVARHVVQRALDDEDDVRGVGRRRKPWALLRTESARFAGDYAETARSVWRTLQPSVDPALHAEYVALSKTVATMAARGIGVDADELDRIGDDFVERESRLEEEIFALADKRFNLASSKQLGEVLFGELGLTVLKRTKTGWSTATEALLRIQHEHGIVPLIVRWRTLQRMRITWITSLKAHIDDDGRVRSTFHPARSFSGRLVNSNPDLGRVPGRTDDMQRIRRAFVAPAGSVILSLDYRQLGLHVLAHLTKDPELVEPLRRCDDMHRLTAAAVLEIPIDSVTKDQRQLGKVVNFATFAGQGASALAQQLAVSPHEAKDLIERFDRRYHVVRRFQDEQLRLARERGYILTIAGRRWPIGGLESLDPQDLSYAERLARRATHEASVADVSRRGLLAADRALVEAGLAGFPLLQIHDEVLFEIPEDEVERSAAVASAAMTTAFELEVPLRVGQKAGRNWADIEPLRASED